MNDQAGVADQITGGNGNNHIQAGNGNDSITLGDGNNDITLGSGNNNLSLGNGIDSFHTHGGVDNISLGAGQYDLWIDGAQDSVTLTGVNSSQLWFQKQGNDLLLSVLGSSEKLTVHNWYSNSTLTKLTTGDGLSVSSTGINQLVQAMAAFAPPMAAQVSYTPREQTALAPLMATSWQ